MKRLIVVGLILLGLVGGVLFLVYPETGLPNPRHDPASLPDAGDRAKAPPQDLVQQPAVGTQQTEQTDAGRSSSGIAATPIADPVSKGPAAGPEPAKSSDDHQGGTTKADSQDAVVPIPGSADRRQDELRTSLEAFFADAAGRSLATHWRFAEVADGPVAVVPGRVVRMASTLVLADGGQRLARRLTANIADWSADGCRLVGVRIDERPVPDLLCTVERGILDWREGTDPGERELVVESVRQARFAASIQELGILRPGKTLTFAGQDFQVARIPVAGSAASGQASARIALATTIDHHNAGLDLGSGYPAVPGDFDDFILDLARRDNGSLAVVRIERVLSAWDRPADGPPSFHLQKVELDLQ